MQFAAQCKHACLCSRAWSQECPPHCHLVGFDASLAARRRIMLSHMLLHTLIARSSRTARLTADQGVQLGMLLCALCRPQCFKLTCVSVCHA